MSNPKLTTHEAVERINAGLMGRAFRKYLVFPAGLTALYTLIVVLGFLGIGDVVPGEDLSGIVLTVAGIWTFYYAWVGLVATEAKYKAVARTMDKTLERTGAHWTWCEDSQTYAVHYTDDPHGDDDESDEDADADELGDTEK